MIWFNSVSHASNEILTRCPNALVASATLGAPWSPALTFRCLYWWETLGSVLKTPLHMRTLNRQLGACPQTGGCVPEGMTRREPEKAVDRHTHRVRTKDLQVSLKMMAQRTWKEV